MPMLLNPVTDKTALKKRLVRFWGVEQKSKRKLHYFAQHLEQAGSVGVFGGMVRDFTTLGVNHFRSDIDLVVAAEDAGHLKWLLKDWDSVQNRFGGWRLCVDRWLIDVWLVSNTWAFSQKYIAHDGSLAALPQTTFFNWDAAVFEINSRKLHLIDEYIQNIKSGMLDINLAENPNPVGMVFRTWKIMRKHNISISPRLALYMRDILEKDAKTFIKYGEKQQYKWLIRNELAGLRKDINKHVKLSPLLPYSLPRKQLKLEGNSLWVRL